MPFTDITSNQPSSYISAYLNYLRNNPSSVSQTGESANLLDLLKLQQKLQEENNSSSNATGTTSNSDDSEVLKSLKELIDLISKLLGKNKDKDSETIDIAKIENEANGFAQAAEGEAAGSMFSLNLISTFPAGSETAIDLAQASIAGVSNVQSYIANIQGMPQVGLVPDALSRAENALSFAVDAASQAARYAGIDFKTGSNFSVIA